MLVRLKFLLTACFILTGCATPYQSMTGLTFTGGTFEDKATSRLQKISFYGNGYTDTHTAQKYALFRAAEYARDQQKPWFLMYSRLEDAALNRATLVPNVGQVGGKPAAFAYVQLLDEEAPNATRTSDILQLLYAMKGQPTASATSGQK